MDYKIYIFSDDILKGLTKFDLEKLNLIFARTLNNISSFQILPLEKGKDILVEGNEIIFSENEHLDGIIIDNYQKLGKDKEMIEEQVVVFKKESQKTIFIPLESDLYLLENILQTTSKICQFHLFGISKNEVSDKLENLKGEIKDLRYKVVSNNILTDIYLSYSGQGDMIDDSQVKIASAFKAYMFSENDLGLEDIVFQLLKMRNLTISICENITKGTIVSSLLKNVDFNQFLKKSEIHFFDSIDNNALHKYSLKLLEESGSDIAIVTAGQTVEDKLSFVFAIADKKEVHFYKCSFTLTEGASVMARNTLLYHLVKKLRQNDFSF